MPPWIMGQTWEHLLFAHWEVDPGRLGRLIPAGLEVDLWERRAWVAILPFRMTDVHLRGLPPLPGSGRFLETNVRTYVRHRGRPGIYFFSLEATSRQAVHAARALARLPYRHGAGLLEVDAGTCRYVIRRSEPGYPPARLAVRYHAPGPALPAAAGTLEHFLTERYRLFADVGSGVVLGTEIDHPPWQIAAATADLHHDGLLPPGLGIDREPDLLHLAETQHVRIWPPGL